MSYHDSLKAEINAKLDALQTAGQPMVPRWVTHAICTDHESALAEDNEHSDFWRHGGYMHTRRMVTAECINKRGDGTGKSTSDPPQLLLPGFDREHLQDYYVVERDGEEIAVCVIDMTDGELEAKAQRHEAISSANAAHAQEIRDFIKWRRHSHISDRDEPAFVHPHAVLEAADASERSGWLDQSSEQGGPDHGGDFQ
jgi:hypothetical protein